MRGLIARIVVYIIAQQQDVTKRGPVCRGKNGEGIHTYTHSHTLIPSHGHGNRTHGLRKPTMLHIQPVGALDTTKYKEK